MNIHFGFSYIGLIFLLMLMLPNIIWSKNKPKGYDKYVKNENKVNNTENNTGNNTTENITNNTTNHNKTNIIPDEEETDDKCDGCVCEDGDCVTDCSECDKN